MLLEEVVACTKVPTPSTMTNEAAAGDTPVPEVKAAPGPYSVNFAPPPTTNTST